MLAKIDRAVEHSISQTILSSSYAQSFSNDADIDSILVQLREELFDSHASLRVPRPKAELEASGVYAGLLKASMSTQVNEVLTEEMISAIVEVSSKAIAASSKTDAAIASMKDAVKKKRLENSPSKTYRVYLSPSKGERDFPKGSSKEKANIVSVKEQLDGKEKELVDKAIGGIKDSLSAASKSKIKVKLDEKKIANSLSMSMKGLKSKGNISKVESVSDDGTRTTVYSSTDNRSSSPLRDVVIGLKPTLTDTLEITVDYPFADKSTLSSIDILSVKTPKQIEISKKIALPDGASSFRIREDSKALPPYIWNYIQFRHEYRLSPSKEWIEIKMNRSRVSDPILLEGQGTQLEYRGVFKRKDVPFEVLSLYYDSTVEPRIASNEYSSIREAILLQKNVLELKNVYRKTDVRVSADGLTRTNLGVYLSEYSLVVSGLSTAQRGDLKVFTTKELTPVSDPGLVTEWAYHLTKDNELILNQSQLGRDVFVSVASTPAALSRAQQGVELRPRQVVSDLKSVRITHLEPEGKTTKVFRPADQKSLTYLIGFIDLNAKDIEFLTLKGTDSQGKDISSSLFSTLVPFINGTEASTPGRYSVDSANGRVYYYKVNGVSITASFGSSRVVEDKKDSFSVRSGILFCEQDLYTERVEKRIPKGVSSYKIDLMPEYSSNWAIVDDSISIAGYTRLAGSSFIKRVEELPVPLASSSNGISTFVLPVGPLDKSLPYSIDSLSTRKLGSEGGANQYDWSVEEGIRIKVRQLAEDIKMLSCSYSYFPLGLPSDLFFYDDSTKTIFFKEPTSNELLLSFEVHSYKVESPLVEKVSEGQYKYDPIKKELMIDESVRFNDERDKIVVEASQTLGVNTFFDSNPLHVNLAPRYVEIEVTE